MISRVVRCLLFVTLSVLVGGCARSSGLENEQQSISVLRVENRISLSEDVVETSGLAYRKERFWTHNDRGFSARLYEVDPDSGQILREVHPLHSSNEDWEDLAQDEEYLYIADCGNNPGDRIWMTIYKVLWSDMDVARHQGVVNSERIDFRLADVTPDRNNHKHNQDCEALVSVNDELWLFTKNWQDESTRWYRLSKDKPVQAVVAQESYPVSGLITAADIDMETGRLVLLGYKLGFLYVENFIWIIPTRLQDIHWDQAQYYQISPLGQWESIKWLDGDLWLTRESSRIGRAAIGKIKLP